MSSSGYSLTNDHLLIVDPQGRPLAELALTFAVGNDHYRVTTLQETPSGWTGLTADPAITVEITVAQQHLCVELRGPFGPAADVTYFAGSKIAASHAHAFIPDENLGYFPVAQDRTFTLTNQAAMRQRLGVREDLWMLAPPPHVIGFGTLGGAGFSFSIPECLPSDALQVVLLKGTLEFKFLHHVASCDEGRLPRVYIDLGVPSRAAMLDRHLGHARKLGLVNDGKPQPEWWHNPLYCTWGDQCRLALHGTMRRMSLTRERILGWADRIRTFYPGEVNLIIDDGYFHCWGDFRVRPDLYPTVDDFRELIAELKRRNFRVILWYAPFWVDKRAVTVTEHPEWILHRPDGTLLDETGDWKDKHHYDWTHPGLRDFKRTLIHHFLTELDADGFKIDMTYACPPTKDVVPHDPSWAAGNQFCKRVVEFIHTEATAIKPDVFLTVNGVESYLQPFASAVRLNDLFNPTDPAKWYERAELVTKVMPGMAIDVDGWPAGPAKLREYPYVASVYGAPVTYYVEGTEVGDVDFGPVEMNRMASIWAAYAHAPVRGDEKITVDASAGHFERRSASGALRALSLHRRVFIAYGDQSIRVTTNTAMAVAVPFENGVKLKKAVRVNRDGSRVPVDLHIETGRALFFAQDAGDGILYYELT